MGREWEGRSCASFTVLAVNYVWIFKPSLTEFSRNKVCIHNEGKDLCVILIQF